VKDVINSKPPLDNNRDRERDRERREEPYSYLKQSGSKMKVFECTNSMSLISSRYWMKFKR